jgi:hypothetical protein
MHDGGCASHAARGKKELVFGRAWRKGNGYFPGAEKRNHGKLARHEGSERFFFRGVLEMPKKRLDVLDFIADFIAYGN